MITRLRTESEPFDFDGAHVRLAGAIGDPKPVQRPHPPLFIGGSGLRTMRVIAEHADAWNVVGIDIAQAAARSALLDEYCAEIGRDPADITRSTSVAVSYGDPGATRAAVGAALDVGFTHIVLSLAAPYPDRVARWLVDEIVTPSSR